MNERKQLKTELCSHLYLSEKIPTLPPGQKGDKPVRLLAKYNYKGNPSKPGGFDELTVTQGEKLELCRPHPSNPHWWEARNENGEAGFVPASYMMVSLHGGTCLNKKFWYKSSLAWPFSHPVVSQLSQRKQLKNNICYFYIIYWQNGFLFSSECSAKTKYLSHIFCHWYILVSWDFEACLVWRQLDSATCHDYKSTNLHFATVRCKKWEVLSFYTRTSCLRSFPLWNRTYTEIFVTLYL